MKKRLIFIIAAAMMGMFVAGEGAPTKSTLPEQFRKWLDEEVIYIITSLERDVFLKLQTDRERDLFIEAFWQHRDPTPGTPENEFKTEHYRRINYANHFFGRTSTLPGWKTERGRILIILGEALEVQRITQKTGVHNTEIWFYQNKTEMGLPVAFYVVFFQKGSAGDFKLYSPSRDGPQALLTNYEGDVTDYVTAYNDLNDIEPRMAEVSLSLIPGAGLSYSGQPSLASDILLQRVEDASKNMVEEKYAQKFLQYKDSVEVEYSTNYLDSDSLIKVLKDPNGFYFVHYAIEPKRLSVNAYNDTYYTTFKVNGTVSTLGGKRIFQFDRSISITMTEAQMNEANQRPFDLLDLFPLIPGTYKVSILIKNEVSKEFTSCEQTLVIPGESPALQMTSPILGYKTARVDGMKKNLKPFQFGATQISCQPGRVFAKKDSLAVAFQVFGLSAPQKSTGLVRFAFSKNGQPATEKNRAISEYAEFPYVLEEFPLIDFAPAHYNLRVSVLADGKEIIAGTEEFDVSHMETVPRPWFSTKLLPESSDPIYAQLIGSQLFNAGRTDEAKSYLERAYRQKPDSEDAALALAQAYMAAGEAAKIPAILSLFMTPPQPPKYEIYLLCGQAYGKLGEFEKAIEVLDKAISHFGVNANTLNVMGDAYARWGKTKEAIAAWEKSLQLSPDQPDIRKKTDALKEKK